MAKIIPKEEVGQGIFWKGPHGYREEYPQWRWHKNGSVMLVESQDEDDEALEKGYQEVNPSHIRPNALMNLAQDFENMTDRQLHLYAKEHFEIDLPVGAPRASIMKGIFRLFTADPFTKDRLVLLARSIEMNLDQTQIDIQRMVAGELSHLEGVEHETFTEEFYQ